MRPSLPEGHELRPGQAALATCRDRVTLWCMPLHRVAPTRLRFRPKKAHSRSGFFLSVQCWSQPSLVLRTLRLILDSPATFLRWASWMYLWTRPRWACYGPVRCQSGRTSASPSYRNALEETQSSTSRPMRAVMSGPRRVQPKILAVAGVRDSVVMPPASRTSERNARRSSSSCTSSTVRLAVLVGARTVSTAPTLSRKSPSRTTSASRIAASMWALMRAPALRCRRHPAAAGESN